MVKKNEKLCSENSVIHFEISQLKAVIKTTILLRAGPGELDVFRRVCQCRRRDAADFLGSCWFFKFRAHLS